MKLHAGLAAKHWVDLVLLLLWIRESDTDSGGVRTTGKAAYNACSVVAAAAVSR